MPSILGHQVRPASPGLRFARPPSAASTVLSVGPHEGPSSFSAAAAARVPERAGRSVSRGRAGSTGDINKSHNGCHDTANDVSGVPGPARVPTYRNVRATSRERLSVPSAAPEHAPAPLVAAAASIPGSASAVSASVSAAVPSASTSAAPVAAAAAASYSHQHQRSSSSSSAAGPPLPQRAASKPTAAASAWALRERLGSRPISATSDLHHPLGAGRPPILGPGGTSAMRAESFDSSVVASEGICSTVASARDLAAAAAAAASSQTRPSDQAPARRRPSLPIGPPMLALPLASCSNRSDKGSARGGQTCTSDKDSLAILDTDRSIISGPCLPDDEEEAASPLTKLLNRELWSKPQPRACVRHVELRSVSLMGSSLSCDEGQLLRSNSSERLQQLQRQQQQQQQHGEAHEKDQMAPTQSLRSLTSSKEDASRVLEGSVPVACRASSKTNVRPLSEEELNNRKQSAAAFFREANFVNQQVRSDRETQAILKEARQHRVEAQKQLAAELAEAEYKRLRDQRLAAQAPSAPAGPPPKIAASSPSVASEASSSAAPRRISLMEKFGYGVKPKEDSASRTPSKEALPVKVNNMLGIKAGNNDLKERLARRRASVL
mmetsp:Transcript_71798/g.156336  ORF Transcript_71798/g.156336 Transcript_71798/m.156336 type:complete len:609 (+) Transcript_71798:148-1974(+)